MQIEANLMLLDIIQVTETLETLHQEYITKSQQADSEEEAKMYHLLALAKEETIFRLRKIIDKHTSLL